jgi:hypothetical protein
MPGIEVRAGGAPVMVSCNIVNGKSNGVFVHGNGQGTFANTVIKDSLLPTVAIRSDGDPIFYDCCVESSTIFLVKRF